LHNLAMEEHAAGNLKEAKKLYQRAIEIHHVIFSSKSKQSHSEADSAVIASVHDSLGMLLGDEGDHALSMHHLEKGYKIYCQLYGSDNHEVAISLSNLARAWQRMGDGNMAKSLFSKSLKTLRQLGGRADEDIIARNLNALGEIFMEGKEYDEARQLFMECLSARVNLYGEKHVDTVSVMKNLSVLAFTTGSYDEAHTICFTARAIQIELDGTDATVQAAALTGHLAEISRVLGKISDAEVFYKNAISLYRKIYGENHPSISVQINNMASMFVKCKRYEEAEVLYETSRKILTVFHGHGHSSVATSINNLASLNGTLGRFEKAMTLRSEALGILLKLHGSENKVVADELMKIAELLVLKKDLNDAMDACSQALGIRTRLYGASVNHGEIVDSLYLMGRIRVKTGEGVEALKLLEDAIRMQATVEREGGGSSAESSESASRGLASHLDLKQVVANINGSHSSLKTASIIEDYCRLLGDGSDSDEKLLMYGKCVEIRRIILGEEDETVADSLAVMGDILFQRKQFAESMELQRVARTVKVKICGENHPSSILSLNSIAKCLKALGRLDEARSMFEQCVISTRRLYGNKNFSSSVALFELSRMLQLVEEYDTAITMAEQALEIRLDVENHLDGKPCPAYGSSSPQYYLCQLYQLLGELCRALNDAEHAKVYFLKSRNLNRDALDGLESDEGIAALLGLAWALEALGHRDEAAALSPDIKRCTQRVYASKDALFVKELNDMGKILRSRGKYAEALIYFTRALSIGRVIHGQEHINTVDSLEGLAWLLEVQGKSAEASKLHGEVAGLRAALGDSDDEEEGGGLGAVLQSGATSLFGRLSLLLSEKSE
jgi:tetratricopeptide (TPR) repeat protein